MIAPGYCIRGTPEFHVSRQLTHIAESSSRRYHVSGLTWKTAASQYLHILRSTGRGRRYSADNNYNRYINRNTQYTKASSTSYDVASYKWWPKGYASLVKIFLWICLKIYLKFLWTYLSFRTFKKKAKIFMNLNISNCSEKRRFSWSTSMKNCELC